MKKHILLLLFFLLLQSCWNWGAVDDDSYGSIYEPVTLTRTEFESSIRIKEPQPVLKAGKIYIKDDLIFINEKESGFHIFNNSVPGGPMPLAFIEIPQATDLAIRGSIIYAHHAVDLVALSYLPAEDKVQLLHRERNVFPALKSPDGFPHYFFDIPQDRIIIGYQLKTN